MAIFISFIFYGAKVFAYRAKTCRSKKKVLSLPKKNK